MVGNEIDNSGIYIRLTWYFGFFIGFLKTLLCPKNQKGNQNIHHTTFFRNV